MHNGTYRDMRTRRHGRATDAPSRDLSNSRIPNGISARKTDIRARYEQYLALARAAQSSGDAVEIENYYQHAEHYFRLMNEQAPQSISVNQKSASRLAGQRSSGAAMRSSRVPRTDKSRAKSAGK